MTNQNISPQELKGQLEDLKNVLPKGLDRRGSDLFDEFIREHEFGLALHVICDHLLGSTTQMPTPTLIQKIQALHVAMKIEDNCVGSLNAKAAF